MKNPAVEEIKALIVQEAWMRMQKYKYQDRIAAIHEILMEIGLRVGEVMRDERISKSPMA